MRPVVSSTSTKLIWMEAWSLAWMILLLAELKAETKQFEVKYLINILDVFNDLANLNWIALRYAD